MEKFLIGIFMYIGDDPDPILLAEKEYNSYNWHNAMKFLEYQFKDEKNITIAIKKVN